MALAAGFALAPSVASADCSQLTGLETTVDPAGTAAGWCVAGALSVDVQHNIYATLDAPGLWQVELEASGGVTLETVRPIAMTGVDRIAIGALTHSVPALDIGLDIET